MTDQTIHDHIAFVYGADAAPGIEAALRTRLDAFRRAHPQPPALPPAERVTERDALLITYGDSIREAGKPPLQSLGEFLAHHAGDALSGVHILPFFPYTSDDGFSVVDYHAVDPALGTWPDVTALSQEFRLMFDGVINHISQASDWFQGFLRGEEPYRDYFITADPAADLSQVVRPRALPLLTPFPTPEGTAHVWTTFSADQIDLNYANPQVTLAIVDVLLDYVAKGASLIRLDAIGFMWKEIGTDCMHRPQVHRLIQLFRAVLDEVAPNVLLVTETNVPHAENISYFGDGRNEAQMVYNFTLPPLTLHAFATGDARPLQAWAATLTTPSDQTTWFNFMASHDGIGLRPVEGILSGDAVQALVDRVLAHGGRVSFRHQPDGSQTPYELNITYFDALNNPAGGEPVETQVDRFIASQAILVGMAGVPGIYIHSLLGSRNWQEGLAQTGRNRTINREKLDRVKLEAELAQPDSLRRQVFDRYRALLTARRSHPAFHPNAAQRILPGNPALFAFLRTAGDGDRDRAGHVLCVHNVTAQEQTFTANTADLGMDPSGPWHDLLTHTQLTATQTITLPLPPYGIRWMGREGGW